MIIRSETHDSMLTSYSKEIPHSISSLQSIISHSKGPPFAQKSYLSSPPSTIWSQRNPRSSIRFHPELAIYSIRKPLAPEQVLFLPHQFPCTTPTLTFFLQTMSFTTSISQLVFFPLSLSKQTCIFQYKY